MKITECPYLDGKCGTHAQCTNCSKRSAGAQAPAERGRKMKIPTMLEEYLELTEQDSSNMTNAELFEEARWVLSMDKSGDWCGTKEEVKQLKSFITRIAKKLR